MSDAFRIISRALHYTSKVSASIRQQWLFYPLIHLDEDTQEKYQLTNTIPSNGELVNRLRELNLQFLVFIFAVYKRRYFVIPIKVIETPEYRNQVQAFTTLLHDFKYDESLRRRTSVLDLEDLLQVRDDGLEGHVKYSIRLILHIVDSNKPIANSGLEIAVQNMDEENQAIGRARSEETIFEDAMEEEQEMINESIRQDADEINRTFETPIILIKSLLL